jgi:hypothetical protein
MSKNLGSADRLIRVAVGIAALVGAFAIGLGSVASILMLAVGAIMLGTAAVGFCPLYRVFGVCTLPTAKG